MKYEFVQTKPFEISTKWKIKLGIYLLPFALFFIISGMIIGILYLAPLLIKISEYVKFISEYVKSILS